MSPISALSTPLEQLTNQPKLPHCLGSDGAEDNHEKAGSISDAVTLVWRLGVTRFRTDFGARGLLRLLDFRFGPPPRSQKACRRITCPHDQFPNCAKADYFYVASLGRLNLQ